MVLRDLNLERLKSILDEAATDSSPGSSTSTPEFQTVSCFYNGFMNEDAMNAASISELLPTIQQIHDKKHGDDITELVAELHVKYNARVFFGMYSSPDRKNSVHTICSLTQSGLGLPDRDYYFDADKESKREKYIEYIANILAVIGREGGIERFATSKQCQQIALQIFAFEVKIARSHLTRAELRDQEKTYNKMNPSELISLTHEDGWASYLTIGSPRRSFDWSAYFAAIGKPAAVFGDINVLCPQATRQAVLLMSDPVVSDYLCFHLVSTLAPHLHADLMSLHFDFFEKELKGTAEQRPRWKRALEFVETALGEALGQKYCAKYFAGDAKTKALAIVEKVRDCLRERLEEVDWMKRPETREAALLKMSGFKVKIGYPDEWSVIMMLRCLLCMNICCTTVYGCFSVGWIIRHCLLAAATWTTCGTPTCFTLD
jgi:putative endopeptidase